MLTAITGRAAVQLCQMSVQPFGLPQGPGKSVQDVAAGGVRLGQSRRHHSIDQVIGNQLARAP